MQVSCVCNNLKINQETVVYEKFKLEYFIKKGELKCFNTFFSYITSLICSQCNYKSNKFNCSKAQNKHVNL